MTGSHPTTRRWKATALVVGAAGTALAGALVQFVVQPGTDVSDERWSYPWTAGALVAVSVVYAVLHGLVAVGLQGFGQSGATGPSRAARRGVALAVAGTVLLIIAELASIPIRDAEMSDTGAAIVGATFGLGTLVSAIGLLIAGKATLDAGVWLGWRRFVPLLTGIWALALVGVAATAALPAGVGVYGLGLLAMGAALHRDPAPVATTARSADPRPRPA